MIYDSIIIGAGPASLSAALYLKNANKNILILEKNAPGGKLLKTDKINNYLGFKNRYDLEVESISDMHPGICARVLLDRDSIGIIGRLKQKK